MNIVVEKKTGVFNVGRRGGFICTSDNKRGALVVETLSPAIPDWLSDSCVFTFHTSVTGDVLLVLFLL
jgi:hypothetical protein